MLAAAAAALTATYAHVRPAYRFLLQIRAALGCTETFGEDAPIKISVGLATCIPDA